MLLAYRLRGVLLVIYVSVLFAVVINPAVEQMQRLRIAKWSPKRGTATLLTFLLVTSGFGLFALFALPPIVHDVQQLAADWPQKSAALYEPIRHLPLADRVPPASLQQHLSAIIGLLKIKYFYALAVFSGLANIVPILGPLVSLVLAGVVAAFDSWGKLIGVIAFYFVYQQVENAYLTPRIMKATLDLPPLAVIVSLSLGGALAGIVGAFVAVPTAALIDVFLDEYQTKSANRARSPGDAVSTL